MKKYYSIAVALVASLSFVAMYLVHSKDYDSLFIANIDALSQNETSPYDVRDYILEHTIHTIQATVSPSLDVTLFGKKVSVVGATIGLTYTFIFQQATCTLYAPGNLCPDARNGEIKVLSFF